MSDREDSTGATRSERQQRDSALERVRALAAATEEDLVAWLDDAITARLARRRESPASTVATETAAEDDAPTMPTQAATPPPVEPVLSPPQERLAEPEPAVGPPAAPSRSTARRRRRPRTRAARRRPAAALRIDAGTGIRRHHPHRPRVPRRGPRGRHRTRTPPRLGRPRRRQDRVRRGRSVGVRRPLPTGRVLRPPGEDSTARGSDWSAPSRRWRATPRSLSRRCAGAPSPGRPRRRCRPSMPNSDAPCSRGSASTTACRSGTIPPSTRPGVRALRFAERPCSVGCETTSRRRGTARARHRSSSSTASSASNRGTTSRRWSTTFTGPWSRWLSPEWRPYLRGSSALPRVILASGGSRSSRWDRSPRGDPDGSTSSCTRPTVTSLRSSCRCTSTDDRACSHRLDGAVAAAGIHPGGPNTAGARFGPFYSAYTNRSGFSPASSGRTKRPSLRTKTPSNQISPPPHSGVWMSTRSQCCAERLPLSASL